MYLNLDGLIELCTSLILIRLLICNPSYHKHHFVPISNAYCLIACMLLLAEAHAARTKCNESNVKTIQVLRTVQGRRALRIACSNVKFPCLVSAIVKMRPTQQESEGHTQSLVH